MLHQIFVGYDPSIQLGSVPFPLSGRPNTHLSRRVQCSSLGRPLDRTHFCSSGIRIGRSVCIQIIRTVYPHPTPASGRTVITIDKHRYIVRLDDMLAVEKIMEIVIHDSEIFFSKSYPPIRHVLSGNRHSIPLKHLSRR